ncbi:MAG: ComEC/Rec2 family competence protein, partial [Clostridia bacterium]
RWFRESGVSHLLAVSGLHVGFLFGMLQLLLRPFAWKPWQRTALLSGMLMVYAMLTGLTPSVLRASLMLILLEGSHAVGRQSDPITLLAAAAGMILFFRPLDLFSLSFQLSFGAILGIIVLGGTLQRLMPEMRGVTKWLSSMLIMTGSAQAGTTMSVLRAFGALPMIGWVINLVAIPLAGYLLPLAVVVVAADFIWHPLAEVLAWPVQGLAATLLFITRMGAKASFLTLRAAAPAWYLEAAVWLGLFCCSDAWRLAGWKRFTCMGVLAIACVSLSCFSPKPMATYTQLDVGQGTA